MPTLCDSSLISQYEYNDSSWVLSLTLRGTGETRHYQEVSPEIYDDMLKADSLGRFVGTHIFKKFKVLLDSEIPAEAYEGGGLPPKAVEAVYAEVDRQQQEPTESRIRTVSNSTFEELEASLMPNKNPSDDMPAPTVPAIDPKKMDAVDKMAAAVTAMANRPVPAIKDQASYQAVQIEVNALKKDCKLFVELVDPFVKIAYKAYTDQLEKRTSVEKPVKLAIDNRNRALNAWESELERRAREAQRAAQIEADRVAEEERKRLSEELTMAAVDEALIEGDEERANLLFDTPVEAPVQLVYAPRIEPGFTPMAGVSKRDKWVGEVTDFEALILDIAEGIKLKRSGKDTAGHAPSTFVEPATTEINNQAKASRDTKKFPGIRFFNDPVRSTRNAK